tara:strand:- start:204 stop:629 length:426 start_codon:yes stop_codon:yes gene_type:complete
VLKSEWQLLIKDSSVFLDLLGVSILEGSESLSVFLLGLEEIFIPLLVELLVLLDMSLLALLLLLGLVEDQFLKFLLIILLFELLKPLLSHLGFHILALGLTVISMLVQYLPIPRYKKWLHIYEFLVLTCILGCFLCLAAGT